MSVPSQTYCEECGCSYEDFPGDCACRWKQAEADAKTAIFSLRSLYEMLEAEQPFPCPLIFGPDGSIWFSTPTIHGRSRTTYPRLA